MALYLLEVVGNSSAARFRPGGPMTPAALLWQAQPRPSQGLTADGAAVTFPFGPLPSRASPDVAPQGPCDGRTRGRI